MWCKVWCRYKINILHEVITECSSKKSINSTAILLKSAGIGRRYAFLSIVRLDHIVYSMFHIPFFSLCWQLKCGTWRVGNNGQVCGITWSLEFGCCSDTPGVPISVVCTCNTGRWQASTRLLLYNILNVWTRCFTASTINFGCSIVKGTARSAHSILIYSGKLYVYKRHATHRSHDGLEQVYAGLP